MIKNLNKKKITLIAAGLVVLFALLAIALPYNIGRYLGNVFTITSITVFMLTMNNAINKLGTYLSYKHTNLLKENSTQVGSKGYRLKPYSIYKNRKNFYAKNDAEVTRLVDLAIRSFFLNFWIFPALFIISMLVIMGVK